MSERASSMIRSNAVLLFIMHTRDGGGPRTLAVVEAEAKHEVGANSEELKCREDKG